MTDTVTQLVQMAHSDAIYVPPALLVAFLFLFLLFVVTHEPELQTSLVSWEAPDGG
jgi:hypothetical protein